MAEPPQTGIETSSVFPSLSAPSSPPDASDEAARPRKSPWSQIVRGSLNSPRSKVVDLPPSCDPYPDEQTGKLHQSNLSSELKVADRATTVNTTATFSSSIDRRQGAHESHSEVLANSPDGSVNLSVFSDAKPSQQSPVKSPKLAWGKLVSNPVQSSEPEPVMGAVAWPPLSEARNPRPLEPLKAGTSQKPSSKGTSLFNERHHLQASPLLQQETGGVEHQETNDKSTLNGHDTTNFVVHETQSPRKSLQGTDADQSKWAGGKDAKVAAAIDASPVHSKGAITSHVNNKESSRNLMWEQGRGNHSLPAYGRGHASSREHLIPAHQQRGGQRNVPQPFIPYANPNPGFVYPGGYPAVAGVDVSGSMYYMPAPTTDPVLGASYFVHPSVFMPAPDIVTIQGMVVKQIEYYFSVENLCRDIYLRSKMDEWGFVPVSVIANFNRVRMITQNPYLILEALRLSNFVEVQGDKVRKKGDWANWLLPSGQPLATTMGDKDQTPQVLPSSKKADEDHSMPDHANHSGIDNQINGNPHFVSQVGERIEALSVTAANIQGVSQESQSQEEAAGSLSDEESEDPQVDGVNSKHSAQLCDVKSGPGAK